MIPIKIRPWEVIGGIEHVETSWRVATDVGMTNLIDEVVQSSTDVTIYYSPVVIPLNTTYYVSIRRHFLDGSNVTTVGDWTIAKPIVNSEFESSLITESEITVDRPYVYMDNAELLDDTIPTFTIRTSTFRANNEGHGYTHYMIYDSVGELIYHKLNDTVNLTSLTIDKALINIGARNSIKVVVVHGTLTNIESDIGSKSVILSETNIEIVSRLNRVVPYTDYTLILTKVNPDKLLNLLSISVTTLDEAEILYTISTTGEELSYVLPGRIMTSSSELLLILETTDGNNNVKIRKPISVIDSLEGFLTQTDYKYNDTLTYLREEYLTRLTDGVSYYTLTSGDVVGIPAGTKSVIKYNVDLNGHKLTTGLAISGLETLTTINDTTYMDFRSDSTFLIDCLDSNNTATFLVYKYDWYRNTAVLTKVLNRPTETKAVGFNNGLVRISDYEYLYTPIGTNIINKLDISTMVITKVFDIPNTSVYNTLMDIGSNKLAIFTGTKDVLIYDITRQDTYPGLALPDMFLNRDLKVIKLINGNSIITTKTKITGDDDSFLVYDFITSTLSTNVQDFNSGGELYTSSIILSSGECLLFNTTTSFDKYFIYR